MKTTQQKILLQEKLDETNNLQVDLSGFKLGILHELIEFRSCLGISEIDYEHEQVFAHVVKLRSAIAALQSELRAELSRP